MFTCCISFDSYIKPQPSDATKPQSLVVYLLIPTSNHNTRCKGLKHRTVVYLLIPTSNHNFRMIYCKISTVVYLLIPTSNHNLECLFKVLFWVVYLLIPTSNHNCRLRRPLLRRLYIFWFLHQTTTTNGSAPDRAELYIFWFLHQTTTYRFECTDFQYITTTLSNKKWWVEYNF